MQIKTKKSNLSMYMTQASERHPVGAFIKPAVAGNSQTGGNLIKSSESIPLLRYLFCIKIYRRQRGASVAVVGGTAYIHHQQQNSALVQ